ncbi:hypothetical protein [Companilactobacillus sp. DQM5]
MKELFDFIWNAPWWQATLAVIALTGIFSGIIGSAFKRHRRRY